MLIYLIKCITIGYDLWVYFRHCISPPLSLSKPVCIRQFYLLVYDRHSIGALITSELPILDGLCTNVSQTVARRIKKGHGSDTKRYLVDIAGKDKPLLLDAYRLHCVFLEIICLRQMVNQTRNLDVYIPTEFEIHFIDFEEIKLWVKNIPSSIESWICSMVWDAPATEQLDFVQSNNFTVLFNVEFFF